MTHHATSARFVGVVTPEILADAGIAVDDLRAVMNDLAKKMAAAIDAEMTKVIVGDHIHTEPAGIMGSHHAMCRCMVVPMTPPGPVIHVEMA